MSLPIDPAALALVSLVAFGASLLGSVAGYGTGLLLPPVLVPLLGAEAVVLVIAVSAILTNVSRVAAYRAWLDRGLALRIGAFALPGTALAARGFAALDGDGATLVFGLTPLVFIPLRRWARHAELRLGPAGASLAGLGYGAVVGGTAGSGVILLTILMAAGLTGAAVIATDAAVTIALASLKSATFLLAGSLPTDMVLLALVIGSAAFPGAFLARHLALRMGTRTPTTILDGAVTVGGVLLIWEALR